MHNIKYCLFTLVVAISTFSALASAQEVDAANDPYNSYLWNRDNALSGSSDVDRGDWFEWWYYKVVDPVTQQAFFFTYGVINPWDTTHTISTSAAVVQFGDFQKNVIVSKKYPLEQFTASYLATDVHVAENHATNKRIQGHVTDDNGNDFAWDLSMNNLWTFDAMGWAMDVPEISGIYWYPAQASATMTGWLRVNGHTINLDQAPAYQDRNWGRSFPKWWTWLTSNNFKNSPGTTLAAGGGEPRILSAVYLFAGLCVGLKYNGEDYVFRSMDLDKFDFTIKWGEWNVVAENGSNQRIEISAYAPPTQFMDIPFAAPDGEPFHDYEALLGKMTVKLYNWDYVQGSWTQIADLETDDAGIEWGSPTPVGSMDANSFSTLYNTASPLR